MVDQFLIASEFKIGFAWMGLYFFVIYIFYNVIYYYEHNEEDRVSFEVFDWDPEPGKACLWVFLILAFFVPGFTAFHVFIYRYVRACVCVLCVVSCGGGGARCVLFLFFWSWAQPCVFILHSLVRCQKREKHLYSPPPA